MPITNSLIYIEQHNVTKCITGYASWQSNIGIDAQYSLTSALKMIQPETSKLLDASSSDEAAVTSSDTPVQPLSTGHTKLHGIDRVWYSISKETQAQGSRILSYFARLTAAFGNRFVLSVIFIYGINHGIGMPWKSIATTFYFSDAPPKGINLAETRAQKILGFADVPWQVKSVYGIFSDLVPIAGFKRGPYIFIAGVVGTIAWASLWGLDSNVVFIGLFLFLGNFSVAVPDVMIDASVAERCRSHPEYASDLQTLCMGSMSVGKLIASLTAGMIYEYIGSRGLFLVNSLTGLILLAPSCFNWLRESPVLPFAPVSQRKGIFDKFSAALSDSNQGPVIKLSLSFLVVSYVLGMLAGADLDTSLFVFITFVVTVLVTCLDLLF